MSRCHDGVDVATLVFEMTSQSEKRSPFIDPSKRLGIVSTRVQLFCDSYLFWKKNGDFVYCPLEVGAFYEDSQCKRKFDMFTCLGKVKTAY